MLVGSALWAATLGRYDILYATNTYARYNILSREGHLNGMLQVFDYLKTFKKAKLVFDYRDFTQDSGEEIEHSWRELCIDSLRELFCYLVIDCFFHRICCLRGIECRLRHVAQKIWCRIYQVSHRDYICRILQLP